MDIDIENLYRTILDLHYVRNSLVNHKDLERSATYIEQKFQEYGLVLESQTFKIEKLDVEFKNIIAVYNPGQSQEFIVTSHYDHITDSVGADDNLSGVSVMLETARIIATMDLQITVRFICFTLEEGHSGFIKVVTDKEKQLGLITEEELATSYANKHFFDIAQKEVFNALVHGQKLSTAMDKVLLDHKNDLTGNQKEYLLFRKEIFDDQEKSNSGSFGLVGSTQYVTMNSLKSENILGLLNLETCGYTSKQKNSQTFPTGLDFNDFPNKGIKDATIGDYIVVVADKYSSQLGNAFLDQSEGLVPTLLVSVGMDYEELRKNARDLLRSDHAPFWKEHLPALMITDTANFRNPYYHTPADTIQTLDFQFLVKLTETVIKTVKSYNDSFIAK